MFARERLIPAPGRARLRSAYLGGAMRVSTWRAALVDSSSMVPRLTATLALRWRRLACGDMALGLFRVFAAEDTRFMVSLHAWVQTSVERSPRNLVRATAPW
jgi:hypothetical protein